ncbi:MAG: hypothetical protein OXL34_17595 [Gemmatimonadota bacterium]|nr:hypothetical protein [Gemmatimonadota bacterium]
MAERIWIRQEEGRLEGDDLQKLIAEYPELIDGEQVRPDDARRWILIGREKGIAETLDVGARWSLDHLIIDQDARPTLAEVKLRDNPEIHRKVVGQILEYAAHAASGSCSISDSSSTRSLFRSLPRARAFLTSRLN